MPRYRGTEEGTASLVGRLLILIAAGKETSATLAEKLGVSPRQVNRYVNQLQEAGWEIERHGARRRGDIWMELKSPRIILPTPDQSATPSTS
jgi:predicted DNA-binding transcriptional regulator YafY